jgi:small-conductance mechanosensitive channel
LRGVVIVWFAIGGLYGATFYLPAGHDLLVVLWKILMVAAILSATVLLSRVAVGFVQNYCQRTEGVLPSTIFSNITRIAVYIIGILVALQSLGISITPILTALGVGGLAVALALQDTLSNLFSGIHILLSKQVRRGDYIRLSATEEGYVTDITWRNTTILAMSNNMIIVPNSKLATAIITNFNLPEGDLSLLVQVGVSYDSDLERVERIAIEVGRGIMAELPGGVPEFEPAVRYHTLGDSSINFNVVLRAKAFADQYLIRHEYIKRLKKRFDSEGIEIPFPIRTVYLKGGSINAM